MFAVPVPGAPRRRDDIETHLMPDGSALLYDPATSEGHALNITGSFIWEYCDGTLLPDQIAAELVAVLPQVAGLHDEALRLIADFAEMGLFANTIDLPAAPSSARTASSGQQENP
jgi:hypothetical protein